jgi:hypothetical protein
MDMFGKVSMFVGVAVVLGGLFFGAKYLLKKYGNAGVSGKVGGGGGGPQPK